MHTAHFCWHVLALVALQRWRRGGQSIPCYLRADSDLVVEIRFVPSVLVRGS